MRQNDVHNDFNNGRYEIVTINTLQLNHYMNHDVVVIWKQTPLSFNLGVSVSRFLFPVTRFQFPVSCFPLPDSRFPFLVSRLPFPVSRSPRSFSSFPFPLSHSRFPFLVFHPRFPFPVPHPRFPFPVSHPRFPFTVSHPSFPFPGCRFLFPVSRFPCPSAVSGFMFSVPRSSQENLDLGHLKLLLWLIYDSLISNLRFESTDWLN